MKKCFIVFALFLGMLCSCTKEVPAELTVSTTEMSFSKDGGSQNLAFKTNKDWTAKSSASWLKVTASGQSSMPSITVTVDANPDYDDRFATISITVEDLTQAINVKQSTNEGLIVSKTEYELSYEAQSIEVETKHNVDYEVIIDEACKDWIKKDGTKGLVSNVELFTISKNNSPYIRNGQIFIQQSGGKTSQIITITQKDGPIPFTDASFKAYCIANFDTNSDGEISVSEASIVKAINVAGTPQSIGQIESLVGIEFFTSLDSLHCEHNKIASLDVSKNSSLTHLICSGNQLSFLDVSKNIALTELTCDNNQLTNLDLSENTALIWLWCYSNQLTNLDVSKNTALTHLYCNNNQFASLNVSDNTDLTRLECSDNQLTSLNVSNNIALTHMYCNNNQLTNLDVSKNTSLTRLKCSGNQLTSLDVTNNTALTRLECGGNQLTSLDVSNNTALTGLQCNENQLTSLDVSKNTALVLLYCTDNPKLTELWLKTGQTIKTLYKDDHTTIKYKD